jgi:hypothetical protein
MSGERMVGPHPAVVISYDNASRTCRVRIPAITDGGAVGALAQICYPIGDKSREGTHPTEIRDPKDAVPHKHASKTVVAAITDVYYEPIEAGDVLEESSEDGGPIDKFYDVIDVKNGLVIVEDEDGDKQMLSQTDIDDRGLFKNAEASDEARKERGEYTDEELQSFQDEADYDAWRDRDI